MAQEGRFYPVDGSTEMEVDQMDCRQSPTGHLEEDITWQLLPMSVTEAHILINFGLHQALLENFKIDFTLRIITKGLQMAIPNIYESLKENLSQFVQNFLNHIQRKIVPFHEHLRNLDVLSQLAVKSRLLTAVEGTNICAYLEIDNDSKHFKIFAENKDSIQAVIQIIKYNLLEKEIVIDGNIKLALNQNEKWCQFQKSIVSFSDNNEFCLKTVGNTILISGLNEAVNKTYYYLNSLISELQIDKNPPSNERLAESYIEVDCPVSDSNVFAFLKTFYNTLCGIDLRETKEQTTQGFTLKGLSEDVERAEKTLECMVNQITDKHIPFQDEGYFMTEEGRHFLDETVEKDCRVIFEPHNKVENRNSSMAQNPVRKTISTTVSHHDGHRCLIWKVEKKCQIILVESKAEESSAEVLVNIVEKKTPDLEFYWQKKSSSMILKMSVPKYVPSPHIQFISECLTKLFDEVVVKNKHGSVAFSIDSAGSWPVEAFVPKIIRSFTKFLHDGETADSLQFSLLLCSTIPDNMNKAEKIIQQILEECGKKRCDQQVADTPIQVRIVEGKLHETEADVLVNTTAPDLDLSNGTVSKSLLSAAGKEIQREIYRKYSRYIELNPGEITVTKGYKLKCKHVIHGVLRSFEDEPMGEVYRTNINQFVKVCLEEAHSLHCRMMAFPAVGTGKLDYPLEIVASEMFQAVEEFSKENPKSMLKEVLFVLYPGDKRAIEVFKEIQAEKAGQEASSKSSEVVLHIVGPAANIEKARQHIQNRLDQRKSKAENLAQSTTEEIHGVSNIAYTLLSNFHGDLLSKWEDQGLKFELENEVLKISGDETDKLAVKSEIETFTEDVSKLTKVACSVRDIDSDIVESNIEKIHPEVCCVYIPEEKVVICGKDEHLVQTELNTLRDALSASVHEGQQKSLRTRAEESSKLTVEAVPEDVYLVMCERYADMKKYVVTYNDSNETAVINKKYCEKFQRCLAETKKLQRQDITIPEGKKVLVFREGVKVSRVNDVICIHDFEHGTISVFGPDINSVESEIHRIKLQAGLRQETRRNKRQLTESYEAPKSDVITNSSSSHKSEDLQMKRYQRADVHCGGARLKEYSKKTTVIFGSYNCETFHTSEGIPVKVYTKNILHLNVDCIVNAANGTLKHGGGVAKVISKAAGPSLDKECADYIKDSGKLMAGEVFSSNAGRLPFKCVIHAVGPCWTDYNQHKPVEVSRCEHDLKKAVMNSLKEAEKKHMETIAVPAISSAIFGVPEDICTRMYAEAVIAYSKQATRPTKLKEIHFVDSNPNIIKSIQKRFREILKSGLDCPKKYTGRSVNTTGVSKADSSKRKHSSSETSAVHHNFPYVEEKSYEGGFKLQLHCYFSETFRLIIEEGSVFDKARSVDAIVCSDNKAGDNKGYIVKALYDKGDQSYRMAKAKAFGQAKFGDVIVLNGSGTGFKKVFLAVMWHKEPGDTEEHRGKKFITMFKLIFRKSVTEKCKSVVMPLLFTGQGKVKPDYCTERFFESCMEFSEQNSQLLTVFLINNEKWKTETIKQIIKDLVNVQTALRLSTPSAGTPSVPARPLLQRSASTGQVKKASNQTNKPRSHQGKPGLSRNSRHNASGPPPSQKQYKNNNATSKRPSSWQNEAAGSNSVFYVDEEDKDDADAQWDSAERVTDDVDDYDATDDYDDADDNYQDKGHSQDKQEENCVICMDTVSQPKKLKCGHVFCTDCIDSYFTSYKKVCPTCGVVCGVIEGDQPPGRMDVKFDKNFHCAGYERAGSIIITYSFDPGVQGPDHPNPGRPYKGITRVAYLPDNEEGREVWKMLEVAFKRKLVFTIGSSRTTGQEGVITWNDIHHKTNPKPHASFGYPDPGYLDRVKDELAVKGVTPKDIPATYRCK